MKYYPICLRIEGRPCLVVGGGRVAERKARGLLDSGARVTVISPDLSPGLGRLHDEGRLDWQARGYRPGDIEGFFLAMAATDDPAVQDQVQADAARYRILLNVADVPDKCNFILPALVKRGPLTVAISTGGNSPALAKQLQGELEARLSPDYARLTEALGLIRPQVLGRGLPQAENERIFQGLVDGDLLARLGRGHWPDIARYLEERLGPDLPAELLARLKKLLGP